MASNYPPMSSYGRTLKPSVKAKEALYDSAGKAYDQSRKQLEHISDEIYHMMYLRDSASNIRPKFQIWKERYDKLTEANINLLRVIPSMNTYQHTGIHKEHLANYRATRDEIEDYIQDSASCTSERDQIMSQAEEINGGSLMAELKRHTRQLEERIQDLSMKLQATQSQPQPLMSKQTLFQPPIGKSLHRVKEDVHVKVRDVSVVPASILGRVKGHSTPKGPGSVSSISSGGSRRSLPPRMQPQPQSLRKAVPAAPVTQDPTLQVLNKLADIIKENKKEQLPPREPDVFIGDITKFPSWLNAVESLIEPKLDYARDGLTYLSMYTDGVPRKIIQGFLNIDTDQSYYDAKERLVERYGNKYKTAEAYKKKLVNWPEIAKGDVEGLQTYSDFLWQCYSGMDSIEYLSSLNHAEENIRMIRKLPTHLADRWNRKVVRWTTRGDHLCSGEFHIGYPPFLEYCAFVAEETQIAEGPCNISAIKRSDSADTEGKSKKGNNRSASKGQQYGGAVTAAATRAAPVNSEAPSNSRYNPAVPYCMYCKKEGHHIRTCGIFLGKDGDTKSKFAKANRMCFGCLRKGHTYKECHSRDPELLKDPSGTQSAHAQATATGEQDELIDEANDDALDSALLNQSAEQGNSLATQISTGKPGTSTSMIMPVTVSNPETGKSMVIYASIDSASDCCVVSDMVAKALGMKQYPVNLRLTTLTSSQMVPSNVVRELNVQGLNEEKTVCLSKCYTRPAVPCNRSNIPRPEEVRKWPHLEEVASQLKPYDETIPVGLLIGFNCPIAFQVKQHVSRDDHEPFGFKNVFGWSVIGPTSSIPNELNQGTCCITAMEETTAELMQDVFNAGFDDVKGDHRVSKEDRQFLEQMANGLKQLPNGHYQLPLPFKEEMPRLPNNRASAVAAAERLRRKLTKDEEYCKEYAKAMQDNIDRGYVERVPEAELSLNDGTVNFVQHHGVRHPQKGTLRPVYNASYLYHGVSLNQYLLSGPDLTNNLTGVLIRFREEEIVITCDIEKMFYQVYVAPEHRNYLRFLWYEDSDPSKPLVEYRFLVHMFGATSSPGCVNYALKSTADQYAHKHGEEAAQFIRRFFYVDDGIKGVPSVEKGVELITRSHALCLEGGFNLTKYLSNSREVMAAIPKELLAKEVREVNFCNPKEILPIGKSLGCLWVIENDTLQFRIQFTSPQLPLTRRTMLSTLGSVYDPLGLASPVILRGRQLLQKMCRMDLGWDDPVPEDIANEWMTWIQDLMCLKDKSITRCYRHGLQGDLKLVQLHHFSDASMQGHGCCSYLRLEDFQGNVTVNLVTAKAKVNPFRVVTIPRLELQAAVLSVSMSEFLQEELTYDQIQHYYWSDSRVALGYIANQSRRFHVYVSNRVQRIHDSSSPSQWSYVATDENPADLTSRGVTARDIINNDLWWSGPTFLKDFQESTATTGLHFLSPDDPEWRVEKCILTTHVTTQPPMTSYFEAVSSWSKLVRSVALWKCYIKRLKAKVNHQPLPDVSLTVADCVQARNVIVRHAQQQAFPAEYAALSQYPMNREDIRTRKNKIKRTSTLFRLDPYLDRAGLIRVGGRVKRSSLGEDMKHPVLLPKQHHITNIIIGELHSAVHHSGTGITLHHVRSSGYWVVKGRATIRRFITACVICHKLRGRPAVQIMADLPADRLQHSVPPFTFCGVDLFGPIMIKQGRAEKKKWICYFTCMVSRSSHMEVVPSLSTDSFLNAYRRFVNRRGPIQLLRCDQGTNFVGAQNDLKRALEEMDHHRIQQTLVKEGCDWIKFQYNAPSASYQGGAWERLIGVTKRIFDGIVTTHGSRFDEDLLHTFITEVECILNNRPLSYQDTTNIDSEHVISPSLLLTMKRKVILPFPGRFEKHDLYCRKRWRFVQYLANLFWQQWIKAYLPTLQERQKWQIAGDNLKVDDLVLIVDANLPRNKWLLARVANIIVDSDHGVRRVRVKTATGFLERPIQKLVLLLRPKPSERDDATDDEP